MSAAAVSIIPLRTLPGISPGDDLAGMILAALARESIALADGDIVVVAQKVVSKAENRSRRLADIEPSEKARELAESTDKDPRLVELILSESRRVVRAAGS